MSCRGRRGWVAELAKSKAVLVSIYTKCLSLEETGRKMKNKNFSLICTVKSFFTIYVSAHKIAVQSCLFLLWMFVKKLGKHTCGNIHSIKLCSAIECMFLNKLNCLI